MEALKDLRRQKGWSQKDLAEFSGVGQDTISGIESGRHEPRPSTLRKLAVALEVEVADFFKEPVPLGEASKEAGQSRLERAKEAGLHAMRRAEESAAREKPIVELVREAAAKQAEQDRQTIARAAESGQPQVSHVHHENEAMKLLLERNPNNLAEACIDLAKCIQDLEQMNAQLGGELERIRLEHARELARSTDS